LIKKKENKIKNKFRENNKNKNKVANSRDFFFSSSLLFGGSPGRMERGRARARGGSRGGRGGFNSKSSSLAPSSTPSQSSVEREGRRGGGRGGRGRGTSSRASERDIKEVTATRGGRGGSRGRGASALSKTRNDDSKAAPSPSPVRGRGASNGIVSRGGRSRGGRGRSVGKYETTVVTNGDFNQEGGHYVRGGSSRGRGRGSRGGSRGGARGRGRRSGFTARRPRRILSGYERHLEETANKATDHEVAYEEYKARGREKREKIVKQKEKMRNISNKRKNGKPLFLNEKEAREYHRVITRKAEQRIKELFDVDIDRKSSFRKQQKNHQQQINETDETNNCINGNITVNNNEDNNINNRKEKRKNKKNKKSGLSSTTNSVVNTKETTKDDPKLTTATSEPPIVEDDHEDYHANNDREEIDDVEIEIRDEANKYSFSFEFNGDRHQLKEEDKYGLSFLMEQLQPQQGMSYNNATETRCYSLLIDDAFSTPVTYSLAQEQFCWNVSTPSNEKKEDEEGEEEEEVENEAEEKCDEAKAMSWDRKRLDSMTLSQVSLRDTLLQILTVDTLSPLSFNVLELRQLRVLKKIVMEVDASFHLMNRHRSLGDKVKR